MAKSYLISDRDYGRLQNMLRWFERNFRNLGPNFRRRSISAGGGGGGSGIFATVVQGVSYPDAAADPPEGVSTYVCRLESESLSAWNDLTEYNTGDVVEGSDGRKYTCAVTNTGNDPVTTTGYWTVEAEITPKVLNYETVTDMRRFQPFHETGDTVELFQKNGTYYFAQQMTCVADANLDGSLAWNATDKRMMAVYG